MHLIIPFASCTQAACLQSLESLPLPHLAQLLTTLQPVHTDRADEYTRSPPHERALAAALGLAAPDGQIAWAAHEARLHGMGQDGQAWALVTPCHWQVGTDHITMGGLDALALDAADSRALLATVTPWFAEDGLQLSWLRPDRWLATGEVFRGLATASLDRVEGRNIDVWMPEGRQAAPLRRLQNEMQMLLYHHPVNDARQAQGLPAINSFWLSGTGALPAGESPVDGPVRVVPDLRRAALAEDWPAWQAAWQALDAGACADLLHALKAGSAVRLTLCGERAAQTWAPVRTSLWQRIAQTIGRQSPSTVLKAL